MRWLPNRALVTLWANDLCGRMGARRSQTVNSRHERVKDLLRRHRGIATKCLASYLASYLE